ncbi:MAG: nitroreductase family protein [Methanobacteriaceae archaeon]|nr:nitroreductase family protein [Methanobacteriaceae archaeon]
MDVFEAIKNRCSVRSYKNKEIEEEKLNKILEAGRLAPSAKNKQNWKFIIVKNQKIKDKLTKASSDQKFISEAPVIIVACGTNTDYTMACGQKSYNIDVSIAVSFMMLECFEQGLGSCWLGRFNEKEYHDILNIPEEACVVATLVVGYGKENPNKTSRKSIEEIISYDKYQ